MIRSLKLFAFCVESLRAAEREAAANPTRFNDNIVKSMQNKVDGWLDWIHTADDAALARDVPPFIGKPRKTGYQGVSVNIKEQLKANHTPEEIERFTKMLNREL